MVCRDRRACVSRCDASGLGTDLNGRLVRIFSSRGARVDSGLKGRFFFRDENADPTATTALVLRMVQIRLVGRTCSLCATVVGGLPSGISFLQGYSNLGQRRIDDGVCSFFRTPQHCAHVYVPCTFCIPACQRRPSHDGRISCSISKENDKRFIYDKRVSLLVCRVGLQIDTPLFTDLVKGEKNPGRERVNMSRPAKYFLNQ